MNFQTIGPQQVSIGLPKLREPPLTGLLSLKLLLLEPPLDGNRRSWLVDSWDATIKYKIEIPHQPGLHTEGSLRRRESRKRFDEIGYGSN